MRVYPYLSPPLCLLRCALAFKCTDRPQRIAEERLSSGPPSRSLPSSSYGSALAGHRPAAQSITSAQSVRSVRRRILESQERQFKTFPLRSNNLKASESPL